MLSTVKIKEYNGPLLAYNRPDPYLMFYISYHSNACACVR